jgi:2-succinyl-5-enolpyruvyl-6-hydroxy-3-cyclohexene-1-carboxylate synthase
MISPKSPAERCLSTAPNGNIAFCEALLIEIARAGVDHLCICPGSRSAPLAIASLRVPELHPWVHLDERAAAFFSLGLAKNSGNATALFCTSGTAAANFYPAVIEAWYSQVPLIVLTADRPAELREWGAGQTIRQTHLFGNHIRWFAEAPLPEANDAILRTARALGSRAAIIAQAKIKGPVHLNLPFREPLTPELSEEDRKNLQKLSLSTSQGRGGNAAAYIRTFPPCEEVPEQVIQELCQLVKTQTRGILLCGEQSSGNDFCEQVARFSNIACWPVIADPVSQLRFGPHTEKIPLLSTGDLLLRGLCFGKCMVPGCIVHIGATLTGKSARTWALEHSECRHILLDEQQRWNDPDHLVSDLLSYDPTQLLHQLSEALENDDFIRKERLWFDTWRRAEQIAKRTLSKEFEQNSRLLEPAIGECLVACLPEKCDLFLASSMPIRNIDSFAPLSTKSVRVFSNRGTNGIDGVISSALGVAADNGFRKNRRQTVLLTGDLTFLHDIGGLLAARRNQLDLIIIVINNDGGGIFSLLPVSQYSREANFESFFTTPHGLSFHSAAELYGLDYQRVDSLSSFKSSLQESSHNSCTRVIELCVDRSESVAFQKKLISYVIRNVEVSCTQEFFLHD